MKPLIIVTPLYDDERESLWMLPGYLKSIREAGGWTITLDLSADEQYLRSVVSLSNGILLSGGHDVNPALYGEPMFPTCGPDNSTRDNMEMRLLNFANMYDLPCLGICRGMQMMNVFYGGTLLQDISTEAPTPINHNEDAGSHDRVAHNVIVDPNSKLYEIVGQGSIGVNSFHHQGVKRLASALSPAAKAPDGLIEACEHRGRSFMLGVQWHPEFLVDQQEHARRVFEAFVQAAQHRANQPHD